VVIGRWDRELGRRTLSATTTLLDRRRRWRHPPLRARSAKLRLRFPLKIGGVVLATLSRREKNPQFRYPIVF